MKTQITASKVMTAPAFAGQVTTAKLTEVSSRKPPTRIVYRWTDFYLPGEKIGWSLLPNEYTTVKTATAAAVKIGAAVK